MVVLIDQGDSMLAIRRGRGAHIGGCSAPSSGKIEAGDSEAEAVLREAEEEVGLAVVPIRRVSQWRLKADHYDLFWWLARWQDEHLKLSERGLSAASSVPRAKYLACGFCFEGACGLFAEMLPAPMVSNSGFQFLTALPRPT